MRGTHPYRLTYPALPAGEAAVTPGPNHRYSSPLLRLIHERLGAGRAEGLGEPLDGTGAAAARPGGERSTCATTERQPAVIQARAFGRGRVLRDGTEIPVGDWGYRQPRELFFYLLLYGPLTRAEIGEFLWPGRRGDDLGEVFHAALFRARQALGSRQSILFHGGRYGWNAALPFWCDVHEFEALLDRAGGLPAGDPRAIPLLRKALSLYEGDFLEEFEGPFWALRREELGSRYAWALLRLGSLCQEQDPACARACYQEALRAGPLLEEASRGLIRS